MPNTNNGRERIAKLEEHNVHTDRTLDAVAETLVKIQKSVTTIERTLANHKGFLAGLAFAFTTLGSFAAIAGHYLASKLGIEL